MNDTTAASNPLLEIDTNFHSYLSIHTRSYQSHLVNGGALDYAFDADYSMRQKINSLPNGSKLYKHILSHDMPLTSKWLFARSEVVGALKYPNIYEIAKTCAKRLQTIVPVVYVREGVDTPEIVSFGGDGIEASIAVTKGLVDMLTPKEMQFVIGRELGRVQNNHPVYIMAAPYMSIKPRENYVQWEPIQLESGGGQFSYTLVEWLRMSEVTADRAGIICLDDPYDFPEIFAGIAAKKLPDISGNALSPIDLASALGEYKVLRTTPARNIIVKPTWSFAMRRLFAGIEFSSCETMMNWRNDINSNELHVISNQILEIRCDIIIGAGKEGV